MEKKILILNDKHHSNIGGTETYTKNLIKILVNNGYKIFEINFYSEENENLIGKKYQNITHKIKFYPISFKIFNLPNLFWNFISSTLKFNKLINKIIKREKINTVIDNTVKSIPYIKKKKINYIWVSHFDIIRLYNEQKRLVTKFIKLMALRPNKFRYNKIVVFSQKDKEWILQNIKKSKENKILVCPLAHKNYKELNNFDVREKANQAKNIIYMGRFDQDLKNINFIAKIAQKLINDNIYIYIYGDGPDKNIIIDKPGIKYRGAFEKDKVNQILKEAKLLILPSFSEGFPYVVVEALSNGVPCLVANTFNNASYLVNETRGECINNFDVNYWTKEIKFFYNLNRNDYVKFSQNALNFAKENLTNEKFENFWKKLL